MLLMLLFVALAASVHLYAPSTRKIFSLVGLCFASVAAAVLLIDYFIQVTVVPLSLEKGQLDGWAVLTMYNPYGVFIALEELGYLLMSLALALLAPVFVGRNRVERAIRWVLLLNFLAVVVWLTLIVAGPLVAVVLRRATADSWHA